MKAIGIIVGLVMMIGGFLGMVIGSLAKWVALFSACFALYASQGLMAAIWAAIAGFFTMFGILVVGFVVMAIGAGIFFTCIK